MGMRFYFQGGPCYYSYKIHKLFGVEKKRNCGLEGGVKAMTMQVRGGERLLLRVMMYGQDSMTAELPRKNALPYRLVRLSRPLERPPRGNPEGTSLFAAAG